MKPFLTSLTLMIAAGNLVAQDNASQGIDGLRVSLQNLFYTKVQFGVGSGTQGNPGDPIPGIDHFYDDGFVRVDDTGNFGNLTTFWGYEYASQVQGDTGSQTMAFHSLQPAPVPPGTLGSQELEHLPGLEVQAFHLFGEKDGRQLGLEAGIGFFARSQKHSGETGLIAVRDSYDANLPALPQPGYSGTPDDTSPYLLGDIPARTTLGGTGTWDFDVNLWTLRAGLFTAVLINDHFTVSLHGGALITIAKGSLSFSETYSDVPYEGKASDTSILLGGYAGISMTYQLLPDLGLFLGCQYQRHEDFRVEAHGRQATLDLSEALLGQLGMEYKF